MAMHENLKINITFEETRVRGSDEFKCVILAEEVGDWIFVHETLCGDSWEEIKAKYPDVRDLLLYFFNTENWTARDRRGNRDIRIGEIYGHEGLYEHDPENPVIVQWEEV